MTDTATPRRIGSDRHQHGRPHRLRRHAARSRRHRRQTRPRCCVARSNSASTTSTPRRSMAGGEVNRRIRDALAPYRRRPRHRQQGRRRATPAKTRFPWRAAQRPAELRAAVEDDLRQLGLDRIAGGQSAAPRPRARPGRRGRPDRRPRRPTGRDDRAARRGQDRRHRHQQRAARCAAARAAGGHRLRAERLQPARPFAGRHARCLRGTGHRVGAVLPARVGVPGFPKVADNPVVADIAGELGATPAQVGLAWLLAHTPNTLLIPGHALGRPPGGEHRCHATSR